jgi:beta-lactamase class A
VGLAARRLSDGEEALIHADQPFHPASTIKICIMMEAYRQANAGKISLDDPITVHNQFRSIADDSSYALDVKDDSETELYNCIGQLFSRRQLIRRMITASSNLASNLLLEELGPQRVTAFMQELGTSELQVLRGFEDKLAYRRGMNSSATARGFLHILTQLARHEVISSEASSEMIDILGEQQFNEMIPAGLPAGVRVAHKTGWAADYHHDVGIVYPPHAPPYVLCVLTKGYEEENDPEAYALVASLSRAVYEEWSGDRSSV